MQSENILSPYQSFIHISRYSRWLPELKRRETWPETVQRYVDFFVQERGDRDPELVEVMTKEIGPAIEQMKVMPSMRVLMTAGEALRRSNIAAFNCSYLAVNTKRSFSEALYILLSGTGVGFSCERQEVNKLPPVPEVLEQSDDLIVVEDSKEGWAKSYAKLINYLYQGDIPKISYDKVRPAGARLRTFGGRACLTGDTLVYKDRKKSQDYNEVTIRQLYEMKNRLGKWSHTATHFSDIKLRSLDEKTGEFYRNQLLDVIHNGVAPVYKVTTESGYSIRATGNHRFMDALGDYKFVSHFSVGEPIAVNGSTEPKTGECMTCGVAVSRRAIRCRGCVNLSQLKGDCLETTARQRKECRSYKEGREECERCCSKGPRLTTHHKDKDPHNNAHSNLELLCEPCHQKHHAKENTFGNPYSHKYVSFDVIASIVFVGNEEVYDLSMQAPDHNFVANGFVSHNSGPGPLKRLFEYTVSQFMKAKGRKLNSLEVHDLLCVIGEIVVVGGVRRAALISLSNLSDQRMRDAKSGNWWVDQPQRTLANNSVAYTEKPEASVFMEEWLSLVKSKSGERGIFNRVAAQKQASRYGRRSSTESYGCNPCCFTGDMNLLTSEGYKPFSELAGSSVKLVNKDGSITEGSVWSSGVKPTVLVKFEVASGQAAIRCTPDHIFMLSDGGECEAQHLEGKQVMPHQGGPLKAPSVSAVVKQPDAEVFDFTEPETHWGVVEGLVVHNSEIILRDKQFCNLSEIVIRAEDTKESIRAKARIATIIGTVQATLTDFKFLGETWKKNTEEEALLGVSMTGIMDNKFMAGLEDREDLAQFLNELREYCSEVNKGWAEKLGINPSAAITCVKPSGTVSQLTNTASGIHARHNTNYVRTVRLDKKDPVYKLLSRHSFPMEDEVTRPDNTAVASFAMTAPAGAVTRGDMTALEQLDIWLLYQRNWCEHKPSVTVSVGDDEWMEVGAWVWKHFDEVSGISFLPRSDHTYQQAPYQDMTEAGLAAWVTANPTPEIDWKGLAEFETDDETTGVQQLACVSGVCEI